MREIVTDRNGNGVCYVVDDGGLILRTEINGSRREEKDDRYIVGSVMGSDEAVNLYLPETFTTDLLKVSRLVIFHSSGPTVTVDKIKSVEDHC